VTGRPTLLMTQRLAAADGSFAGIVFAAIDLGHFRSFYRSFEVNQNRSVTLMKTNGTVLVHQRDGEMGKNLKSSELFVKRLINSTTGLYSIVSPFDGKRKQFAYEVAPDFPVIISVALAEEEILQRWSQERRLDFALAGGISIILLMLALILAAQFRKRSTMARLLRERERGYRLLAENVEDVVQRVSPDGRRLYVSPSIVKLLGFTPGEIVDMPLRKRSSRPPANRSVGFGKLGTGQSYSDLRVLGSPKERTVRLV
jgi:PAS domain-containing protein